MAHKFLVPNYISVVRMGPQEWFCTKCLKASALLMRNGALNRSRGALYVLSRLIDLPRVWILDAWPDEKKHSKKVLDSWKTKRAWKEHRKERIKLVWVGHLCRNMVSGWRPLSSEYSMTRHRTLNEIEQYCKQIRWNLSTRCYVWRGGGSECSWTDCEGEFCIAKKVINQHRS